MAENISELLRSLPGVEFRTVPALSTGIGDRQTELTEFVWTTPERIALFEDSLGDESEPQSGDAPPLGATVIVHSTVTRRGPNSKAVPPPAVAPESEEFRSNGSAVLSVEEFASQSFFTRTRVILGVVSLVLVAALIAVLNRPAHVSKLPIPVQQDQASTTEIPEKQPAVWTEPDVAPAQPESNIIKTEAEKPPIVKRPIIKSGSKLPLAAQPQVPDRAPVENRVKKEIQETPAPYNEESGGVSQKDVPALLKMAQADAGAGNYDKARTEFRKILGLQRDNQDAREGLHKLDIIQKDHQ